MKNKTICSIFTAAAFVLLLLFSTNPAAAKSSLRINWGKISIEFDRNLNSRVITQVNGKETALGKYSASEYLIVNDNAVSKFKLTTHTESKTQNGKEFKISGTSGNITKNITITGYDNFPSLLFYSVSYTNNSKSALVTDGWINNHYIFSSNTPSEGKPLFWSYLPGSYGWDNDWIQKLNKGFQRDNYLGMNNIDYGGGTPILDVWRQDIGLAVGHVETVPKIVSLPASVNEKNEAELSVKYARSITLQPGESLKTFNTFVSVHNGDYFSTLTDYSRFMEQQGLKFTQAPEDAYQTEWCGWGYEKDFTMAQFYGAFPMVKKLGIDCITLDYGWESAVGDYYLPKDKFPNGDIDMKHVVDSIHAIGKKARLWWMPLSVYPKTDLFSDHYDYMLLNENQSPVIIQFWKAFFLCPASDEVKRITKEFVVKAFKEWGYDGLKIDGNSLNMVPPCYNPAHKHAYPEQSVEQLPELFKIIYETALSINPNAVIQICPCGTNQSFYILPYMNQTVASDPHNSWHVRIKGKTLHGLTQSKTVFAGDHVELSDDKSDFASTIGIGGVPATKFVWPVGSHINKETGDIALTPEKEAVWAKWIKIYNDNKLTKGIYRGGLYDIGFDYPETHAIQKDDVMYYAFYAKSFDGQVELRGLENKSYKIVDYENGKELGTVNGNGAKLSVKFDKHLLIKVIPAGNN